MKLLCPICNNATTWEENPWKPFCSERCKLIDLGKWILEEYKIDGKEAVNNEQGEGTKETKHDN